MIPIDQLGLRWVTPSTGERVPHHELSLALQREYPRDGQDWTSSDPRWGYVGYVTV